MNPRTGQRLSHRLLEQLERFEPMLGSRLIEGNRITLLAGGPAFLARLIEDIAGARASVHLETYIFADDAAGSAVADALEAAVRRGVQVRVLVDSFGGGEPARRLRQRLAACGGEVRIFRPHHWWRPERKALRRLHRKLALVDGCVAYVGGINIDGDPARDTFTGEPIGPRFDLAVRCEGSIVAAVRHSMLRLWWAVGVVGMGRMRDPPPMFLPVPPLPPPAVRALFLQRDNLRHRHAIERAYLAAFAEAADRIVLANAYFHPGWRFRSALADAVRRGVRVTLLLQGRSEHPLQHRAQFALYGRLLDAGIDIREYRASYLHAKACVVDGRWTTVGSSNIDPLSLLLAREANVVVRDASFAAQVEQRLREAIEQGSVPLRAQDFGSRSWARRVGDWIAYALVRAATVVLASGRDY